MKIGILTHYDVNNQGAQLQLYAMYMQLTSMGHNPIVLTYRKNYDLIPELELRNQISLKSVPYILKNFLWEKGFGLTYHNVRKYLKNKAFRKEHFRFAPYCLADINAAVVGADEVMSLELGANIMMYGHGVNTDRLIAYAPSAGQTDINRIVHFHYKELAASGLSKFSCLSARDEGTQKMIKELIGKDVPLVCDPVLLYRFPMKNLNLPKGTPRKPYIVVYSYDARFIKPKEIEAIRTYARRHRLKTVSVGTYHKWCDVNIACDCLQWLKCIEKAQAVITDTFHGTISAAITNRPMVVSYSPAINSSKMLDLVKRLGLNDRLIAELNAGDIEKILTTPMDTEALSQRIENLRKDSLNYLTNALQAISNEK